MQFNKKSRQILIVLYQKTISIMCDALVACQTIMESKNSLLLLSIPWITISSHATIRHYLIKEKLHSF